MENKYGQGFSRMTMVKPTILLQHECILFHNSVITKKKKKKEKTVIP